MIESQNSQRINKIVQKAQNFLKNNPKDPAHDYYHHKRVWDLCKRIIQQEDLKINEKAVKKVYDAVRYHEYGDNPKTKEGKVVQDANKLDGFSKKREKRARKAIEKGEMKEEALEKYKNILRKWKPEIRDKFHFKTSKLIFNKRKDNVG